MRVEEGFHQTPFPEEHPYKDDPVLSNLLKRILPPHVFACLESDFVQFGDRLVHGIRPLSTLVQPAQLTQYNHWGERVDVLHTSEGWRQLTHFAISSGLVHIPHARPHGEHSRLYGIAKMLVATGDTHVIMCPLGMTDGASRVIELYGTDAMKRELLPRLISIDPSKAYLSGQWMTERPGGSDLSQTETTAIPVSMLPNDLGPPFLLTGFKWFSSAAEGHLALALARTGPADLGSRGLSAFVVPLRLGPAFPSPLANGVRMHRLKDKVGTRGVPTAELSLSDTRAWLIGRENDGVRTLAALLNITRLQSAAHSTGSLARALAIARAYATVRAVAGGRQLLAENALHVGTLARVALLHRALVHATLEVARLLGRAECDVADAEEAQRLRLLTPVLKGFAAMRAVGGMEDCMAALGGQGYMEETGIGRLIRDAMVEKIWEGTENIMALDMMRAAKDGKAVTAFVKWATSITASASTTTPELQATLGFLNPALELVPRVLSPTAAANPHVPRVALTFVASVACAIFLLEHAVWSAANGTASHSTDIEAVRRWVQEGDVSNAIADVQRMLALGEGVSQRTKEDLAMVYGCRPLRAKM